MDPLYWQRLERLFEEAIARPAGERAAFLEAAFPGDREPELRRELEELLQSDDREQALGQGRGDVRDLTGGSSQAGRGGEVAGAIAGGLALFARGEGPPENAGPYRILREVGRGGMATVYLAERSDRAFERRVAIKILRRGMDSDDIVRRLRRERQILANLDHPHIARLLDGGTTEDGRSFVVMEHIDGEPIDLYCQRRGLPLEARLELFRKICDAVHYAHQSLVLHRDIKPSNILVTAAGVPKLLDFGIAKVLSGDDDTDQGPEPTGTGWRLLTPEWASPEQVRGEPLTTASDVYSLGLLLYLLVAGRRAYEVDAKRPAELERIVCEVLPPPPGRGSELDAVVLYALRKEPARRYASAEQLGEDLRRYLGKLPVKARRDSFGYRSRTFVRRHRLAVGLAAATFALLLATTLAAVGQARRAQQQSRRAEQSLALAEAQRKRAEQVAGFLEDTFKMSDPSETRGRPPSARELLDQGARRVRLSLGSDPELRADLLDTIGRVYQSLAVYDEAETLLEEAARLRRGIDPAAPATAVSLRNLAQLALDRGQFDKAGELSREAFALFERASPPQPLEVAHSLRQLADLAADFDRFEEAEQLYLRSLAIAEELLGKDAEEVSLVRNSLGELHYQRGRYEEAKAIFAEVLATRRRTLGADHPEVATSLNNLAAAELALRQLPEAEEHQREALAIRRQVFGENHVDVAVALHNLATTQAERGELGPAIDNMEAALQINRRVLGENHPKVADSLHNLAIFHQNAGHPERAIELLGEALQLRRAIYGDGHPAVAQTLRNLGELSISRQPSKAAAYFKEALAIDRHALPPGDYRLAHSLTGLGRVALDRGAYAEAEGLFREALQILDAKKPEDWRRAEAAGWLGRTLDRRRRDPAALPLLEQAVAGLKAKLGEGNPRTRVMAGYLAEARARRSD